jgi:dihydrofolate synthase/folylpolyglutamate synthase
VTAAAFIALARAGVGFGVIEAGLGGRLDATNVIPSRVTALTSVSLEHTDWLGDTTMAIAAEKLAVLRRQSTLVVGRLDPEIDALAAKTAAERGAALERAEEPPPSLRLATPGGYARRNLGVAMSAARAVLGELDPAAVRSVAERTVLPGRMQVIEGEPPLCLDAAHNPEGALALAEALPEVARGRPVVACVAALADKDAAGIVAALTPVIASLVATEVPPERLAAAGRPGSSSHPAAALASLGRDRGAREVEAEPDATRAARRAITLAVERNGVALGCGSHYLLPYVAEARRDQ